MLTKLLRLIPSFRELERDYLALSVDKQRLDDDMRRLRTQFDTQSAALVEALLDGRKSRELVADWISQQYFGFGIYNRGPKLPDIETPIVVSRKPHGRDLVRQAEQEFFDSVAREEATQ